MGDVETVQLVFGCVSLVSMATCTAAIVMLVVLKLHTQVIYRLAGYQVLCAFFWNISTSLILTELRTDESGNSSSVAVSGANTTSSSLGCKIIGFLIVYAMWVKLLFALCLTVHLFSYAVCHVRMEKREWLYVIVSVFFPLLYTWVPFVTKDYGSNGVWCFISGTTSPVVEEFTLYYGPLMFLMSFNLVVLFGTVAFLKLRAVFHNHSVMSSSLSNPYESARKRLVYIKPLLVYPLLLFVMAIFPFVYRVLAARDISYQRNIHFAMATAVIGASVGFIAGSILMIHMCYSHLMGRKKEPVESEVLLFDSNSYSSFNVQF
ncbi:hypothetical protein EMCRGX_G022058 [Ephydatia muelleri]|eukprot:Em0009g697a